MIANPLLAKAMNEAERAAALKRVQDGIERANFVDAMAQQFIRSEVALNGMPAFGCDDQTLIDRGYNLASRLWDTSLARRAELVRQAEELNHGN